MPFQALPSSPGFQLPQAPRWEPFAQGAIEEIRHRPIINTAAMVEKAADQINNILEKQSPEAKMERAMKMMQLKAMHHIWGDFNAHPEKYQMTAHGPVLIDPLAKTERVMRINESIERIKTSQGRRNTIPIVGQLSEIAKKRGVQDVNEPSPAAAEAVSDVPAPDTDKDKETPPEPPPSATDTGEDNTTYFKPPEEPFTIPA